jgi:hypothetical protein
MPARRSLAVHWGGRRLTGFLGSGIGSLGPVIGSLGRVKGDVGPVSRVLVAVLATFGRCTG